MKTEFVTMECDLCAKKETKEPKGWNGYYQVQLIIGSAKPVKYDVCQSCYPESNERKDDVGLLRKIWPLQRRVK